MLLVMKNQKSFLLTIMLYQIPKKSLKILLKELKKEQLRLIESSQNYLKIKKLFLLKSKKALRQIKMETYQLINCETLFLGYVNKTQLIENYKKEMLKGSFQRSTTTIMELQILMIFLHQCSLVMTRSQINLLIE